MYRLFVLSITLGMLAGCGKGLTSGPVSVDPEFLEYVQSFQSEGALRGKDVTAAGISIQFGDMPSEDTNGLCQMSGSSRAIYINRTFWSGAADSQREELIFHELGHCVLLRAHDTHLMLTGNGFSPESIMYPSLPSWGDYEAERARYLDELFH